MTRYSIDHEWIRLEGDTATVGISEYAQQSLGDITFVELPPVGRQFEKGETLAVIESVKAASEIFAPAGGTVTEVNEALADAPEKVNDAPEGEGWLCRLSGVVASDLDNLLTAEQYAEFIASH